MTNLSCAILLGCLLLLSESTSAQTGKFDPPPAKTPEVATLKTIQERTEKLSGLIASLPKTPEVQSNIADVSVYLKAPEWIVRHGEWLTKDSDKQTLAVLDQGIARAELLAKNKTPWMEGKGQVSRGYTSRVDGSVQPYAVIYPPNYPGDAKKKWRLDIVLHGRDSTYTEVKFLAQHGPNRKVPDDQNYIILEAAGRGNNAFRWAGETDVFEMLEHFLATEKVAGRGDRVDLSRLVIRGFSMGGAGSWHLGLHHPSKFAVMGPGAGFTTTHGYIGKLPDPLPYPQEETLRIYDAIRYAENARNIPIVAYSGEVDPQKAAADNIQKRLEDLKIPGMTHIIGPKLAHQFPPEFQKKAELEFQKYAGDGKGRKPSEKVDFITYTLKYPTCDWVTILGLQKHYDLARVQAEVKGDTIVVKTTNVWWISLDVVPLFPNVTSIDIDGQNRLVDRSPKAKTTAFVKIGGIWKIIDPKDLPAELRVLTKHPGLTGPIDDAFTDGFVCIAPTSKGWFAEMDAFALRQLDNFAKDWDKFMRGKLPRFDKSEMLSTAELGKNLVLFGDPKSNPVIAKILPQLPITWTEKELRVDGKTFDPKGHLPVLIFPNPLNPKKYVVLNSGHSFHAAEFRGTNAQLYPRLGDYAVLKPTATEYEAVLAGLFDEHWKFPGK